MERTMKKSKAILAAILAFCLLAQMFVMAPMASAAPADVTTTIEKQQVEYTTNPLGIDVAKPRFSWNMVSDGKGISQTYYQVLVSSTAEKFAAGDYDMWDSGKQQSEASVGIAYEGKPQASSTRYFWKVIVWDQDGKEIHSTQEAWWETGLLNDNDWTAKWIDATVPAETTGPVTTFTVDFDYQVDKQSMGFVLGAKDTNNFYLWQINIYEKKHSYFRPHKWTNGSASVLVEKDIQSIVSDADFYKVHHFSVDVKDGLIVTKIDNQEIDRRTIAGFELGKIGFRQHAGGASDETCYYDNLVIKDGAGKFIFNEDFENADDNEFAEAGTVAGGRLYVNSKSNPYFHTPRVPGVGTSAPTFRKEFTAEKEIKSARLYASAQGMYEIYLNGNKVSNDFFNPGYTDYNIRTMYQTFDVTDMLKQGKNAISAMLGKGWYSGNIFLAGSNVYGSILSLLAQVKIVYTDGSTATVNTDGSWKASTKGPVTYDDFYNGEDYDARKELTGFDQPDYDDGSWKDVTLSAPYKGSLDAQVGPTVQSVTQLPALTVTAKANGTYIYDLGQNFAGVFKANLKGIAGTKAKIRFAEMLTKEGEFYTANMRSARATDYYTFKSNETETYQPRFTYHGYRYIEISGVTEAPGLEDVTGIVLSNANERTGQFESSNALVNQLYSNAWWGQLSNFISIPTDCPQRDERMGYTGDANVFTRTASMNANVNQFFEKWMKDVCDAILPNQGFTDIAPNPKTVFGNTTPFWGDGGITIPWNMYQQYGDKKIIEDSYASMVQHVDYLKSSSNNLVRDQGWTGDWLAYEPSNTYVIGTSTFAHSADLLAKMAKATGKTADAEKYGKLYNDIKQTYIERFVSADGHVTGNSQTGYLVTLNYNLIPDELRANAASYLVENIRARGMLLSTGFIGCSYLTPVLSAEGYDDVAYALLEQTQCPSWLYSVVNGATTIWERWDSYVAETGQFGDTGMNSFNHYSYGSISEWIYNRVLGIERDENNPGYKHIILQPTIGGTFTHAKGSYDSAYGLIKSDWTLDENNIVTFKTTVPANTTATLKLATEKINTITEGGIAAKDAEGVTYVGVENGKTVYELGSGSYEFKYEKEKTYNVKIDSDVKTTAKVKIGDKEYNLPYQGVVKADSKEVEIIDSDSNYKFSHWTGDFAGSITKTTLNIDHDINIVANFKVTGIQSVTTGATVTTTDSGASGNWGGDKMVDGILTSVTGSTGFTSGMTSTDTGGTNPYLITINMGTQKEFNKVALYPRTDTTTSAGFSAGLPRDYTILVSNNGTTFTEVKKVVGQADVNGPIILDVGEQNARYIRVSVTRRGMYAADDAGNYRVQLAEVTAYKELPAGGQATFTLNKAGEGIAKINGVEVTLPYTAQYDVGTDLFIELVPAAGYVARNITAPGFSLPVGEVQVNGKMTLTANFVSTGQSSLASAGCAVTSSNGFTSGDSWKDSNLTNGVTTGTGWTSSIVAGGDASDKKTYVTIDLGSEKVVDKTILYPRTDAESNTANIHYFPQDYIISVSTNGTDFTPVKTVTGHADTASPVTDTFTAINARYIRVTATKLCGKFTSGDGYRFQLAEVEVFAFPPADDDIVSNIVITEQNSKNVINKIGGTLELTATPDVDSDLTWYIHEAGEMTYGGLSDKAWGLVDGNKLTLIGLEAGFVDVVARSSDGGRVVGTYRVEISPKAQVDVKVENEKGEAITQVLTNAPITIKVTLPGDVESLRFVNENDMVMGKTIVSINDNEDGTKTWAVTLSIATAGDGRELNILTAGTDKNYTDTGAKVSIDVKSVSPAVLSAVTDVEESVGINEVFTITVTTTKTIDKVKLSNETGNTVGTLSSSYVIDGNNKIWTLTAKIGSKGSRTIKVSGAPKGSDYLEGMVSFGVTVVAK